jgi:hypothetical protein
MSKNILSALVMMFIATTAFSQTTQAKMDAAKANPQTTQNAAKADAQLTNKKNVSDSVNVTNVLADKKKQLFRKKKSTPKRSA